MFKSIYNLFGIDSTSTGNPKNETNTDPFRKENLGKDSLFEQYINGDPMPPINANDGIISTTHTKDDQNGFLNNYYNTKTRKRRKLSNNRNPDPITQKNENDILIQKSLRNYNPKDQEQGAVISELEMHLNSLIKEKEKIKQELITLKKELNKSKINQSEISELKTKFIPFNKENKAMNIELESNNYELKKNKINQRENSELKTILYPTFPGKDKANIEFDTLKCETNKRKGNQNMIYELNTQLNSLIQKKNKMKHELETMKFNQTCTKSIKK